MKMMHGWSLLASCSTRREEGGWGGVSCGFYAYGHHQENRVLQHNRPAYHMHVA